MNSSWKHLLGMAVLLLSLTGTAVRADHWVVSLKVNGQTDKVPDAFSYGDPQIPGEILVYTCPHDNYNVYTLPDQITPWDGDYPDTPGVIPSDGSEVALGLHVFGDPHEWTYSDTGTATPVAVWTPDGPAGSASTAPVPSTITIREFAFASAHGDFSDGGAGASPTVSDGLGDSPIVTTFYAQPQDYCIPGSTVSLVSSGSRIVTMDTQGSKTITFSTASISAISGSGNGNHLDFGFSVVQPVTATSTAGTVDASRPDWFSGTGCTATGVADLALLYGSTEAIPTGDYITRATLKIGGYPVKTYPDDYAGIQPPTGLTSVPNLAAMFDSTHFSDGSPIVVEVEVYDSIGKSYKAHLTAPAYNRLLDLGNNTLLNALDSVNDVQAAAQGINYDVTPSIQDTVAIILSQLPEHTAFYIDTHGHPDGFADCFYNPDDSSTSTGHSISGSDVSSALLGKSPAYPPYNFAMFDACQVMGDKQDNSSNLDDAGMATGFGLAAGIDRAALGFDWETNDTYDNEQWTKRLWNYLAQGVPLRTAASLSSEDGPELGPGVLPGFDKSLNPVIEGDSNMTLSGVYGNITWTATTTAVPDKTWYKPL